MTALHCPSAPAARRGAAFFGRRDSHLTVVPALERSTVPVKTSPDRALNDLTSEFHDIPVRIVLSIFRSYLNELDEVQAAAAATRRRILDACLVA